MKTKPSDDIFWSNHGSLWLLTPQTKRGKRWVAANIPEDATRWAADSVVVEPRYVANIAAGAEGDGLKQNLEVRL